MAGPVKTEAVVLRSMRYGEADRILHLYTPARGRMSAIAKGVRRARSRFGGRLEPFFRLHMELHEGRSELLTVTGAQTIDGHARLRGDARALDAAARACDAVGACSRPQSPTPASSTCCAVSSALIDGRAGGRAVRNGWRVAQLQAEAAARGGARAGARRVRELRRAGSPGRLLRGGRGSRVLGVRGGSFPLGEEATRS